MISVSALFLKERSRVNTVWCQSRVKQQEPMLKTDSPSSADSVPSCLLQIVVANRPEEAKYNDIVNSSGEVAGLKEQESTEITEVIFLLDPQCTSLA